TVHIEALADADMSIQDSGEDIGTLRIDIAADIQVVTNGTKVSGVANFTRLNLTDPTGKTGLPQDALDSIVSLAKDLLQSRFNEMLGKGKDLEKMDVNLGGIPLTLEHGKVDVLDHAVHVSADVNIADENFAALGFNVNTQEVCSTPPGASPLKMRS
ncbi:Protein F10D11.6 a, partial [Aphelenchoides avenae]